MTATFDGHPPRQIASQITWERAPARPWRPRTGMDAQERTLPAGAVGADSPPEALDDTQLLAQVIHDLKNPLGVILCYADLTMDAPEAERREYGQRLQANARALLEFLDTCALLSDCAAAGLSSSACRSTGAGSCSGSWGSWPR